MGAACSWGSADILSQILTFSAEVRSDDDHFTGELEYWFAMIKVFIIVGLIYDWGWVKGHSAKDGAFNDAVEQVRTTSLLFLFYFISTPDGIFILLWCIWPRSCRTYFKRFCGHRKNHPQRHVIHPTLTKKSIPLVKTLGTRLALRTRTRKMKVCCVHICGTAKVLSE